MNKLEILQDIMDAFILAERASNSLSPKLYIPPESAHLAAQNVLQDALIHVAKLVSGDKNGWIEWYIYDNELGRRALKAGLQGKQKPITNVKNLLEIIDV